ncbi:MAG TPA: hypothetical protein VFP61_11275 [Acidimicrobiales bacterium]|nr:hypothetical protein [Acidimicrobiales bacterium]
MSTTDLPEAAGRRLAAAGWSAALSVSDFAACLQMGMRPAGIVQGFCVMGWQRGLYTYGGYGYRQLDYYPCPHGWGVHDPNEQVNGANWEAAALADVWAAGYNAAHSRMLEEAAARGAHGVIGVIDATKSLIDEHVREFHLVGTAVVLEGAGPAGPPWSTYLAGAKLVKLFEAGLVPVSVAGAYCQVHVLASCATEILEHGRWDATGVVRRGGEVVQLSDAATQARRLVRERLRATLGDCSLHGADLQVAGRGSTHTAVLRGTKVRRVHDVDPLPAPVPTVRLS